MENIEQKLSELKTALEAATEKKMKEAISAEIKALEEKIPSVDELKTGIEDIKQWQVKKDEADKKNQEALDSLIANGQKRDTKSATFNDALGEALEQKKEDLKSYGKKRNQINIDIKAVGNMGAGNLTTSGTETFAGNTFLGVGRKPYNVAHIRDILSVQPITTDSAYVIRDS